MPRKMVIFHTTPVTLTGLQPALNRHLSGVQVINLLDDSILPEILAAGKVTEGVRIRIQAALVHAALTLCPDIMLCACSTIGSAFLASQPFITCPMVRIDMAMAREAVARAERICIAATAPSTLEPTRDLLTELAGQAGKPVLLTNCLIPEAGPLLSAGDLAGYSRMIQERLLPLLDTVDCIVLAQASMAQAVPSFPADLRAKCLSSVESGILSVKMMLGDT
jgi:hypothetical protein